MHPTKLKIAKMIASTWCWIDNPTYQDYIEAIYENRYRTIDKCSIEVFMYGILDSFIVKDLDQANRILTYIKEVVQESLEVPGIELTYTDEDWHDLKFITNPTQWGGPYILSKIDFAHGKIVDRDKRKAYMEEYFEN
jgi:hypothetical protein